MCMIYSLWWLVYELVRHASQLSPTKTMGTCTAAFAIFKFYMSMANTPRSCGEDAISEKAVG